MNLDIHRVGPFDLGGHVQHTKNNWTGHATKRPSDNKRSAERRAVTLPARLTWKDRQGADRFVSAVTRDVSELGVYVECQAAVSIPLYRLVQFQLEREACGAEAVPESLRQGRILSAVYRVLPATAAGARQGLALRLMLDPRRRVNPIDQARATA